MAQTFQSPIDIANRACQHCGVARITDFTDDVKQAAEIGFVYDKVRRAELRRNIWRYAIRKTVIRPVEPTTLKIQPVMWSSTISYPPGAIVSDGIGGLWICMTPNNLGFQPWSSSSWESYFGPLTCDIFDPTTAYFTGELCYEAPGDGTYQVFMSQENSNANDPKVPALWLSGTTYYKDQIVQFPLAWASGTSYAAGRVVSYNGLVYVSLVASNLNHEPDISPTQWTIQYNSSTTSQVSILTNGNTIVTTTVITQTSSQYPSQWSSAQAYSVGNFAAYKGLVYVCITANTNNLPTNTTYWAAQDAAILYQAMTNANTNNEPDLQPAVFSIFTTYASGTQVIATDGYIYTSQVNANLGNNPIIDSGANWLNTYVLGQWQLYTGVPVNQNWVQIQCALSGLDLVYPIGSGPSVDTATRNVFRLPSGFLRQAPTDPKAGSTSYLGAPSGLQYEDWTLEGKYLTSRESTPIMLRFVADVVNVNDMDDMFCEGLGARIALEVVETLTQSPTKKTQINSDYRSFMTEARVVNGIETGSVEPPEDDYIVCRM